MFSFVTLCSLALFASYAHAHQPEFSAERVSSPATILLERCISSGTLYKGSLDWHGLLTRDEIDLTVVHLSSTPLYNPFVYNKDRFQLAINTTGDVKIVGTIRNKKILRECVNRFLETMIPQHSFSFSTDESVHIPFMTPDGCTGVFDVHYDGRKKFGKITVLSLHFEWTVSRDHLAGLIGHTSTRVVL